MTQVLDDASSTGNKLTDIYDSLGIALKDSNGQIRSTYDILADLAEQWDNLSKNEQEYIALTSAGSNQVQNFTALMENFSVAVEATATAYSSAGSASKENEKAMDTIEKKLQVLRSQFEQLVLGEGGLQNLAKGLLDVGIAILKFANSDVGQTIIKTTALISTIALLKKGFIALKESTKLLQLTTLIKDVMALKSGMTTVVSSQLALDIATKGLTKTLLANAAAWVKTPFGMITIAVGAVMALKTAFDHFNEALDKQVEKLDEAKSAYESAQSELESLESQLQNVRNEINEINGQGYIDLTDEKQLRLLKEQEASLEHQLLLQQELAEAAKAEYTETAIQTLTDKNINIWKTEDNGLANKTQANVMEMLEDYTLGLQDAQEEINSLLAKRSELEQANLTETAEYAELNAQIDEAVRARDDLRYATAEYAEIVNSAIDGADEENEVVKEAIGYLDNYYSVLDSLGIELEETSDSIVQLSDDEEGLEDNTDNLSSSIESLASSLGLSNEQLKRFYGLFTASELEEFLQHLYDIQQTIDEASGSIDSLQSALENATEAQAEYSEQGYLTLDTFQSLMGINAEYLVALQNENGQLEINQITLGNLVEQIKQAKIQDLQAAAAADVFAYSQGNVGDMSDYAKELVYGFAGGISEVGNQATQALPAIATFHAAVNGLVEDMGGEVDWHDSGVGAIVNGYLQVAQEIEEITIGTENYGKSSSSVHSESTESIEEEESELEQLQDKYKDVISFILKQYDKQIDKIKEIKEIEIKSVENQIDAINKEKDARLKAIDDEIDALQKQRDAREKYWEEQLDKLDKENKERERNIELQEKQQALALAQQSNVMVLKDNKFVYTQDESAVSSAEQGLAETQEQIEYERLKETIEGLRDAELAQYDDRIQALEDYRNSVEEQYEKQIEQLEEYKDYLEEYYEAQIEALENEKDSVNEILEEGIVDQQAYWNTMMEQLNNFVTEWNNLVGSMTFPDISGSGITLPSVSAKSTGDNKISAYASGKSSIKDSEIAVVGENPKYRELVIGSKLNNDQGTVMALKRGSGVVNAGATNTLASIFNALNGQNSNAQKVSNNTSNTTSITIGSISLPEVKDGKGFVDYLQNFSADITQMAFAR